MAVDKWARAMGEPWQRGKLPKESPTTPLGETLPAHGGVLGGRSTGEPSTSPPWPTGPSAPLHRPPPRDLPVGPPVCMPIFSQHCGCRRRGRGVGGGPQAAGLQGRTRAGGEATHSQAASGGGSRGKPVASGKAEPRQTLRRREGLLRFVPDVGRPATRHRIRTGGHHLKCHADSVFHLDGRRRQGR